jgi:hypothetical protein
MKILDIPQSGKRGLNVSQVGQFGQISRALAIPTNPRTPAQMTIRAVPAQVSGGWRALQEAQRAAWMAAAKEVKSDSRLGQNGPLSGFLLFTKINCTLVRFGQAQVDAPPARPQFPALAPTGLVITNTGGVIALKLTCPTDPGTNTIVGGAAPVSQGRETCDDCRILGTCPAPAQGSANITTLYTARYGVPPVGKKVYVQVNQFVNGWEDLPVEFWAIVPASAQMAAPASDGWVLAAQPLELDFDEVNHPPAGVTGWYFRYRQVGTLPWTEAGPYAENTGILGAVSLGEYEAQMRWEQGSAPELPSEWSKAKSITVPAE